MARRIAPIIKNEIDFEDSSFTLFQEDPHISEIEYEPRFIRMVLNYLSTTKREKSTCLYLYLDSLCGITKKRILHIPHNRIENEFGWSKPTVIKYRSELEEFGLIRQFRLDKNNLKNETRLQVIPAHKIDIGSIIYKIQSESFSNKLTPYTLQYLYSIICRLDIVKDMKNKVDITKIKEKEILYETYLRELKNFTVGGNAEIYNNSNKIEKADRRLKNFTVNILLRNILSIYTQGAKSRPVEIENSFNEVELEKPKTKPLSQKRKLKSKTSYSTKQEIPSKFSIQIKKLRRTMNEFMPNTYRSIKVSDTELIQQANILRLCEKDYNWDQVLKPALIWARTQDFWIKNLRSYSSLRTKWKNGETKIQNLIAQWETQDFDSSNKKEVEQKPEDFYNQKYDQGKFKNVLSSITHPSNKLSLIHKNIQKVETFYFSIPQRIRDYNFFYKSKWDLINSYLEWLDRKIKISDPSYKLLDVEHEMFKRFVEEGIQSDTTISMCICNGKYKFKP